LGFIIGGRHASVGATTWREPVGLVRHLEDLYFRSTRIESL